MKSYSLAFLIIFTLISLRADAKRVPGTIYYKDRQEEVFVVIHERLNGSPNLYKISRRMHYIDASGDKQWLSAKNVEVKEVRLFIDGATYYMAPLHHDHFGRMKYWFAYRVIKGRMSLFQIGPDSGNTNKSPGYLFIHPDGKSHPFNTLSRRKWLAYHFKDCPSLVELINTKNLTVFGLKEIVNYYNTNCN